MDELLRPLWEKSRPIAVERATVLRDLAGDPDELRSTAHKLAGALGMYGFARAGDLARAAEERIAGGTIDGEVARLGAEILAALDD